MINERYCVFDIETWTPTGKVDAEHDELRYIGFKTFDGHKICLHSSQREAIQNTLNYYPYLVGHNVKDYDIPVLKRHGFSIPWTTTIIDTMSIAKNRMKQMMSIDLNMSETSLRSLCNRFKLEHEKGDIDYSILRAEVLTGTNYESLVDYLYGDLDSSEDLFKYFYEFFYGFREYMSEDDQRKMKWLTCSAGATAYKCICNMADLPEEYEDGDFPEKDYEGGYVSEPYKDVVKGSIYCVDFASLYPHMMMGFNLYSPIKEKGEEYFLGSEVYPSVFGNDQDGIRGKYSRYMGKVEHVIQDLYNKRVQVTQQIKLSENTEERKKYEQQRLAIKILINTIYGIAGSPVFKSVYSKTAASDCTALARRSIKHARTVLEMCGYECVYTDTDSVYVLDPFKNYAKFKETVDYITTVQRSNMNISIHTHLFEIESEINIMYFFRDDKGDFVKKHYINVTTDDEVKEKGLQIVKGNCSKLALNIYNDKIKPKILKGTFKFLTAEKALDLVKKYAKKKPETLIKRFRVKAPSTYKIPEGKEEASSMNYQIAVKYGKGEHWLVPTRRFGVGKGVHYATMDEIQTKYGEDWLDEVAFEPFLGDLREFIYWKDRTGNKLRTLARKRVVKDEATKI